MHLQRVAVIGYNRTPFARYKTAFANETNSSLLLAALKGLIDRYHLRNHKLGEVAGGAVIRHISESNLVRETILHTKLHPETPGCDLQQACDTGMQAAVYIANKIALGQIESGIACGVEAMSNLPFHTSDSVRKALLAAASEKRPLRKLKHLLQPAFRDWLPRAYQGKEPVSGMTMGEHTELTAAYYNITRAEQDAFALSSHQKLAAAYDDDFFEDMMTPYAGLTSDNNLRRDTNIAKLSSLQPAFDRNKGTLTAGNATPFSDGASALLLASESWAAAQGLPVLAYITHTETAAIEYIQNPHNLLLAPVIATRRMLNKAGLHLTDFDYYEIHEAFAAQVLATLRIWEDPATAQLFGLSDALGTIDNNKLNVKGSSLATAHPFAATGGRLIATMAKLLHTRGRGRGFLSVCAARGQGVTMIMEK